ncbi:hypothetical protein B0T17DRAFT_496783 [Bombardia bombarda]|uniref:Uncharacterized protein n=1 Tax=Bombardia bombarda TaxID=252184 RepID=A0AA39WHM9_9PEZI|nr:hypothetical protein B0T17DRAFT_496783 [Bombardia bombarda]
MAPPNGAPAKPAKTTARRTASKPVVPVLPLNYPQRPVQKKQSFSPPASSPLAQSQPGRQTTEESSHRVYSKIGRRPQDEDGATLAPPVQAPAEPASPPPVALPTEKPSDTPTATTALLDHPVASPTPTRPSGPPARSFNIPTTFGHASEPTAGPAPIFQPIMVNRPPFHQPHISNGSLMFGWNHDSNASSPAPHPAGAFPPPGLVPYPAATIPATAMDGYGRPVLVSPILDGYPPTVLSQHGPPTPHSFHGSQSSIQADEHTFNHYSTMIGHGGYSADPVIPPMRSHMNSAMHVSASATSGYQNTRDQDELLSFVRHGISDNTFNDCFLEVRFPENPQQRDHHSEYGQQHKGFRIPAHRFILSRSSTLARAMKTQGTARNGAIYLTLYDEYMRPDVFWHSIRSLYGWPLGVGGILPTDVPLQNIQDDFKLTLSYIATGQYLQLGWVHSIAMQRASHMLFWETIELALKFVLPRMMVSPSPRDDEFRVSELLEEIMSFIVHNFPQDFVLDVNEGDWGFSRLPAVVPRHHSPNAPTIANGTSGSPHNNQSPKAQAQMPHNPRLSSNPRFSQIQFGDISPPTTNGHGSAARSHRQPSINETIFSRILLNLPFELLKRILEHPQLTGDLNSSSRLSLIAEIIAERESRRLQSLEKGNPQLMGFQEALDKAAGPLLVGQMGDFMVNNMGFKEEVFPGDLPYLTRVWTRGSMSTAGA